ncbi:MAG: tetratricopeptide repeat protein [Planctomycetes bacterium]|nr:tetratricopeptide repeat protein [Planctomycetota bacterium]
MSSDEWADRLRNARLALELYRDRREKGEAESESAFLRANQPLSDLLEPMLHDRFDTDADEPAAESGIENARRVEGRTLGEFQIVREIGRGGMGVVYEAVQPSLRRTVAIKVLPAHLTLRDNTIQRFHREALTAAKFRHPGIVEIYTVGADDGTHFFAMEFVPGASLDRVITRLKIEPFESLDGESVAVAVRDLARQPSDPNSRVGERATTQSDGAVTWKGSYVETVVRLAAAVAEALDHAHRAGVIHRDVKPSNILLRTDGTPILTDFGLAREEGLPSMTLTGDFVGTPYYVSPQQVVSRSVKVDHRTDVFSLGVTLYELLTLRRPFEGHNSQQIFEKILTREPVDPQKLNPRLASDLATIVLKALEKDPDRRYATAAAFAADLRAFLDYRPIQARRVPGVVRLLRWARREPAKAALLGILTIGVPILAAIGGYAAARLPAMRAEARLYATERGLKAAYLDLGNKRFSSAIAKFERVLAEAPDTPEAIAGIAFTQLETHEGEKALATLDRYGRVIDAYPSFAWIRADALRDAGREAEANAVERNLGEPREALDCFLAGYRKLPRGKYGEPGDPERYGPALQLLTEAAMMQSRALFHFERARAAGLAKDARAARESAFTIETLWPNAPSSWFHVGLALHYVDQPKAIDAFRKAIEHSPSDLAAYGNLASTLYDVGDYHGAIETLRRAVEIDPNDVDTKCSLGITLQAIGENVQAIETLREATRLDRAYPWAHYSLGIALHSLEDYSGAEAAFREAIRLDPKFSRAHARLGLTLQESHDPSQAIPEYREAIRLDPKYAQAHYNLGTALQETGEDDEAIAAFREAIAAYREALELNPKDATTLVNLGGALHRTHDLEGAVVSYRRAIEIDPKQARAHMGLGDALFELGDSERAVTEYRRAIEIDPTLDAAYFELAQTLHDMAEFGAARTALECWTTARPANSKAWAELAYACVYPNADESQHDPAKGLAAAQRALDLAPRLAVAHASLAEILVEKGDLSNAIVACRRALEIDPKDEHAHVALVRALAALGEWVETRRELEKWTAACPDSREAWNRLAWFLVDPNANDAQHDAVAGLAAARRVEAITHGTDVPSLDTLAEALFLNGDVRGAIRTEIRALGILDRTTHPNPSHRQWVESSLERFLKAAERSPATGPR